MKVLMLGNGFDLYHNLLSHYDDFMTIGEYLCKKHKILNFNDLDQITIYSELCNLDNKTIQDKLLIYEDAYKKTEIRKDEYASFLDKIHTNCWFKHFLDIKSRNGWVALENQVAEVLIKFRQRDPKGLDRFWDAIKDKTTYSEGAIHHIWLHMINSKEYTAFFEEQYGQFIDILKLYLKIFVDNLLPSISKHYESHNNYLKNKDYILNFNYTNTYAELYDSKTDIIHIHGKLDDEIVLGVNSDKYDDAGNNDSKYIKYKKYYQRITKHTLDDLMPLFTYIKLTTEPKSLIIIGHSLDVSDGDILTVIFEMFDVIKIYFHDDNALDSYVKNLKLIFGAKELSKMTFSQKVIFRKLPPNEFSEVNTNDKL